MWRKAIRGPLLFTAPRLTSAVTPLEGKFSCLIPALGSGVGSVYGEPDVAAMQIRSVVEQALEPAVDFPRLDMLESPGTPVRTQGRGRVPEREESGKVGQQAAGLPQGLDKRFPPQPCLPRFQRKYEYEMEKSRRPHSPAGSRATHQPVFPNPERGLRRFPLPPLTPAGRRSAWPALPPRPEQKPVGRKQEVGTTGKLWDSEG